METLKRKTSPHTNLNKNDKHCIIVSCFQKRGFKLFLRDHYSCCLASRPRLHYDERIWKRRFYSENTSSVFVHTTPGGFKNAAITSQFRFVFETNSVKEATWLSWSHRFPTVSFSHRFPSTRKQKAFVVKSLRRSWRAFTKSSVFVTG